MEISIWTFLSIPVCRVVCAPLFHSPKHFQTAKFSGCLLPESFHMTCTRPGGIPPPRHVDFLAFSAPLMDCSCRELARGAQTVRREQSLCSKNLRKFLQMPGRWYPSRASGGHTQNSYIFVNDATFAFGACELSAHTAPIKMAIATHVEQTICTVPFPSGIKGQVVGTSGQTCT